MRIADFLSTCVTNLLAKVEAICAGSMERMFAVMDEELKRVIYPWSGILRYDHTSSSPSHPPRRIRF